MFNLSAIISGLLPRLMNQPMGTPAETLMTVPGAVTHGFSQGVQNPAEPIAGLMDLNQRLGGALSNTLGAINPLIGLPRAFQAFDTAWKGRSTAEAMSPPAFQGPMPPDAGASPTVPATDPNVVFSTPFDLDAMPRPPVLEPPPQVDQQRLEAGTRSRIVGSLASGAAQVDPTAPGAFARALASAGGAGATTAGEAQDREAELTYKNALAAYETGVKNKQIQYEYEGKKFAMMLPEMKATDDGIFVQEFKDGKYQGRYIRTDGILGDAGKLKDFTEAMGASGPAAEGLEVQYIAKTLGNDPPALKGTLTRMAVERSLDNGSGPAVFGEHYTKAAEQARTELLQTGSISNDPEKTRKALNKAISAKLLSDPAVMAGDWLPKAAQYGSISANILANGE
jgi:hypothetical protein